MNSSERVMEEGTGLARVVTDPLAAAGLHKPVNNARGQSITSSIASTTAPPMIDATKIGQQQRRPSSTQARIEGMDQLESPDGSYLNMTKAEREMKEEELSFYSASDNDHGDDNIWGLLSGVGGNIYEWCVYFHLIHFPVPFLPAKLAYLLTYLRLFFFFFFFFFIQ